MFSYSLAIHHDGYIICRGSVSLSIICKEAVGGEGSEVDVFLHSAAWDAWQK